MALEADDRTSLDVSTDDRWFLNQCREAAGTIDADRIALRLAVQATLLKWARDGWLKTDDTKHVLGPSGIEKRAVKRTPEQAAAYFADIVDEALGDALSATAREALEIAQ